MTGVRRATAAKVIRRYRNEDLTELDHLLPPHVNLA